MAPKPFESKIQDLVYNVDVGIGLRLIKTGLYCLLILFVMVIYTATQFKGLRNEEAMDNAQLGRNLMYHKQLVTQCVRPASMWYMIENSSDHDPQVNLHPDIIHPPLYPAVLAVVFKLTGANFSSPGGVGLFPPEQWAVIPVGHFFTLLTGILVFLLGKQLFNMRVALLGMTIFFLSNMVWANSISGLPLAMVMFFATLAFYMIILASHRKREGASWLRWILPLVVSVVACIAAFLTRYGAIVLVPAIVLFIGLSFKRGRWILAGAFLVAFLLGIAPWLARNYVVSGGLLGLAPYTVLENTTAFEGDIFQRTLAPSFAGKSLISAVQSKWMLNVNKFLQADLRLLGDGVLMCLFITTFFYRFVRQHVHIFRWCLALGMILLVLLAGFFGESTIRLLVMFWPLVLLYGLAFFFLLLERLHLGLRILNVAVSGALLVLCAIPLIFTLLPPRASLPYPPYFPPFIVHVCDMLEPDEMICTDMPWATAWYGNRNSLEIPATLNEFYTINDYTKRISGLYLTTVSRDQPYVSGLLTGPYRSWFPVMGGRLPPDFPLTQGFPLKELDQLFLTDRKRWEEK